MFSQPKQQPFSLGLPSQIAIEKHKKSTKPLTPAEEYEQALVTASVFLADSRARLAKKLEKHHAVENSSYWFYGYCGSSMMATMAVCLGLGTRIAFLRSYSGWIALAGGYFGGKLCMAAHLSYLIADAVKQLDHEVVETQRMDEQTKHLVPDYSLEVKRLTKLRYELLPTSADAMAAHAQKETPYAEKADALVEAYLKRKEALAKR